MDTPTPDPTQLTDTAPPHNAEQDAERSERDAEQDASTASEDSQVKTTKKPGLIRWWGLAVPPVVIAGAAIGWSLFGDAWVTRQVQAGVQALDLDLGKDHQLQVEIFSGAITVDQAAVDHLDYRNQQRDQLFTSPRLAFDLAVWPSIRDGNYVFNEVRMQDLTLIFDHIDDPSLVRAEKVDDEESDEPPADQADTDWGERLETWYSYWRQYRGDASADSADQADQEAESGEQESEETDDKTPAASEPAPVYHPDFDFVSAPDREMPGTMIIRDLEIGLQQQDPSQVRAGIPTAGSISGSNIGSRIDPSSLNFDLQLAQLGTLTGEIVTETTTDQVLLSWSGVDLSQLDLGISIKRHYAARRNLMHRWLSSNANLMVPLPSPSPTPIAVIKDLVNTSNQC